MVVELKALMLRGYCNAVVMTDKNSYPNRWKGLRPFPGYGSSPDYIITHAMKTGLPFSSAY